MSPKRGRLGVIVRTFKAAVSTECRRHGIEGFGWQRNYYEHIVRNEESLREIREYIANNPLRWELDSLHPNNRGTA